MVQVGTDVVLRLVRKADGRASETDGTHASTARFVAPPVPMIGREVNSPPATVSLDSATLHRC